MALTLSTVTVDASDPARLARWWADALGWKITEEEPDEISVAESDDESGTVLLFVSDPNAKAGKNRIHFDLAPDDQQAEVDRLLGMGATRVDIGQRDVSWVVLADPEGNEFCVLARTVGPVPVRA